MALGLLGSLRRVAANVQDESPGQLLGSAPLQQWERSLKTLCLLPMVTAWPRHTQLPSRGQFGHSRTGSRVIQTQTPGLQPCTEATLTAAAVGGRGGGVLEGPGVSRERTSRVLGQGEAGQGESHPRWIWGPGGAQVRAGSQCQGGGSCGCSFRTAGPGPPSVGADNWTHSGCGDGPVCFWLGRTQRGQTPTLPQNKADPGPREPLRVSGPGTS